MRSTYEAETCEVMSKMYKTFCPMPQMIFAANNVRAAAHSYVPKSEQTLSHAISRYRYHYLYVERCRLHQMIQILWMLCNILLTRQFTRQPGLFEKMAFSTNSFSSPKIDRQSSFRLIDKNQSCNYAGFCILVETTTLAVFERFL